MTHGSGKAATRVALHTALKGLRAECGCRMSRDSVRRLGHWKDQGQLEPWGGVGGD